MQQGKGGDDLASFCPSFNFYSSNGSLADIATKVSREFIEEEEEFEFSLVLGDHEEVVFDRKIHQIFPIFNREIDQKVKTDDDSETIRIPLEKLFINDDREEEEPRTSSSSPSRCKKSKSTGSGSKRWKIRDLLRRCNSERKEPIMLFTPNNKQEKIEKRNSGVKVVGKLKAGGEKAASAHELFYIRNRAEKEVAKRKSYLPYRRDLVGLFASVNGISKNFPF